MNANFVDCCLVNRYCSVLYSIAGPEHRSKVSCLPFKTLVYLAYKYVYKGSVYNVVEEILPSLVEVVAKDVFNSIYYVSYIDEK